MQIIVCIVSGGLLTFVLVCLRGPEPPCPRTHWKCWVALVIGALGAFLYYWLMRLEAPITGMDFFATNIAAIALGGFVYRLLCPIK
jgi:hypothetical protein